MSGSDFSGPSFSEDVLMKQQADLRERYDFPPQEVITDPEVLQTPPSLRGASGADNSDQNEWYNLKQNCIIETEYEFRIML